MQRILPRVILAAILFAATTSAWAQPSCNTTFNPTGSVASWIDGDNWTPPLSGPPDATKVGCIATGKTALIGFAETGEAKAIWIKSGAAVHMFGETENDRDSILILHDDVNSQIDGELVMFVEPHLVIDGDVTIEGTGMIILVPEVDFNFPIIEGADAGSELTLLGEQTGAWDDQTDTLVLMGGGTVDVKLNNRAHVTARNVNRTYAGAPGDDPTPQQDPPLTLDKPARGDGFWIADINTGLLLYTDEPTLDFQDEVTGAGTFVVTGDDDAEIVINAASESATGDVKVFRGTLTLNNNFWTTGNLLVDPDAGSTVKIVLAEGFWAAFD